MKVCYLNNNYYSNMAQIRAYLYTFSDGKTKNKTFKIFNLLKNKCLEL